MEKHIKELLKLQEIDRQLDRVYEDLKRIPKEIEIHDREIAKLQMHFNEYEKKLDDVRSEQKKCKSDREDAVIRIADYKNKLLSLKTNEEYRAMLKQISNTEQLMDELDSRTIELMYREDETSVEIENARKSLDRSVKRAEKRKGLLAVEETDQEKKARTSEKQREELAAAVNVRFLRKYEQLRMSGKGSAVVGLLRGACGGCMTNVPPQSTVEIAQGKTFTCPICGRFIVWTEDSSFAGD